RHPPPAPVSDRLAGRRLYLCTPDRPDLAAFVAACVRGGVDVVQLRDKELDDRDQVARARVLQRLCTGLGVPFVLNDRPDLAAEAGADGVHVGQEDAAPDGARRLLGPEAVIGRSTHSPEDLARAADEPVDYLSAGPVEPTPTKPGRPGTGAVYAGLATARAGKPVFVTGGVTPATVPGLAAAGVRRFVVVRWLTGSNEPEAAARALRQAVDRALAATA
ncbi:MAG: thiamine phosphate synthase, partial [Acidimicrobiales bacterium]